MIRVAIRGSDPVRVEGCKVIIPGFEWANVMATPMIVSYAGEPSENEWVITDVETGHTICGLCRQTTIDAAVRAAADRMRAKGITKEAYRAAQAKHASLNPQ